MTLLSSSPPYAHSVICQPSFFGPEPPLCPALGCARKSLAFGGEKGAARPDLWVFPGWCSRPESNGDQRFRKPPLYPFELREPPDAFGVCHAKNVRQAVCRFDKHANSSEIPRVIPTDAQGSTCWPPSKKLKKRSRQTAWSKHCPGGWLNRFIASAD